MAGMHCRVEEVHTPGVNTIASLAEFLDIPESQTAKAIFLVAEMDAAESADGKTGSTGDVREQFVFVVVRGDMELNETKLTNAIKARRLRPATSEEITAIGAEAGYGSPIGVDRSQVVLIVDDLIPQSANLVAGANRPDMHFRNVNYGRDYEADIVADIVVASEGAACPRCGGAMRAVRGIEVGNIFKLGTKYSDAMGATYLDEDGSTKPIVMGCYGIGSGRLIASAIERHHDENGIQWPITIAPYTVMLVSLPSANAPEVAAAADGIYADLVAGGIEVLYDDRDERAGVKFNDADLVGMPVRVTVGARGLKGGYAELKLRRNGETRELPLDNLVAELQRVIDAETELICSTMVEESME